MNIYKWIKNLFAGAVTEEYMGVPVVPTKPAKKISKAALSKLTKTQLEVKGRELGIELDKRQKKADLVDQLFKTIK
jgi:hypothetical protein|tara:strand:+ start:236 stop:463 length:228 start_codon:yes stop_codon:yes gene_type:complete